MYVCPIGTFSYSIQPGDTLYSLAKRYRTSIETLTYLNPGIDPLKLGIGDTLCIPMASTLKPNEAPCVTYCEYTRIKAGDTIANLAVQYKTTVEAILSANPDVDPYRLMIGSILCIPRRVTPPQARPQTREAQQPLPMPNPMPTPTPIPTPQPTPNCARVRVRAGDYPYSLAKRYNTTVEEILKVNPNIDPNKLVVGSEICIPINSENQGMFSPTSYAPDCARVTIKQGDYPYTLAQRYNTTVEEILKANPNMNPNNLTVGSEICIPLNSKNQEMFPPITEQSPRCVYHVVRSGDMFKTLAEQYNTPLDAIIAANRGLDPTDLQIGQIVCIPMKPSNEETREPQQPNLYCARVRVKQGDYPYSLAQKYITTVAEIMRANPKMNPNNLVVGSEICIPINAANKGLFPPDTELPKCIFHVIKKGDMFKTLAEQYKTPLDEILVANAGLDPYNLKVGQTVCIPVMSTRESIKPTVNCGRVRIQKGDYPYSLAQRYSTTVEEILKLNPNMNPNNLTVGSEICIPMNPENQGLFPPDTLEPAPNCRYHVVKSGDMFKTLAQQYNIPLASIIAANPNVDPTQLQVGQIICIPVINPIMETRETSVCSNKTIEKGDTLVKLARKYGTTVEAILINNPGIDPYSLQVGDVLCIPAAEDFMKINKANLIKRMRLLFDQQAIWTKNLMVDIMFSLPTMQFTQKRLLENAADFADAFRPVYGENNAKQLETLLTERLTLTGDIFQATKANETARVETLNTQLQENADNLATFLSSINRNWDKDEWQRMLSQHASLTQELLKAYVDQKYEDTISLSDEMQKQALYMANVTAEGIAKQHPNRF